MGSNDEIPGSVLRIPRAIDREDSSLRDRRVVTHEYRSWWCGHLCGLVTLARYGYRIHFAEDGWQNNDETYAD